MTTSTDPIEVPYDSLNPDTLRAVVEEFITRNGTDYGEREKTLEQKVADRQPTHRFQPRPPLQPPRQPVAEAARWVAYQDRT